MQTIKQKLPPKLSQSIMLVWTKIEKHFVHSQPGMLFWEQLYLGYVCCPTLSHSTRGDCIGWAIIFVFSSAHLKSPWIGEWGRGRWRNPVCVSRPGKQSTRQSPFFCSGLPPALPGPLGPGLEFILTESPGSRKARGSTSMCPLICWSARMLSRPTKQPEPRAMNTRKHFVPKTQSAFTLQTMAISQFQALKSYERVGFITLTQL